MKTKMYFFLMSMFSIVIMVGCTTTERPRYGFFHTTEEPVPVEITPTVHFTGEDGRKRLLSDLYREVSIIVFSSHKDSSGFIRTSLPLKELKRAQHYGIPVIEVAWNKEGYKSTLKDLDIDKRLNLYTYLSDPSARIHKLFGVGKEDRVFLVRKTGRVENVVAPGQIGKIISEAIEMQSDIRRAYEFY